MRLNAKSLNFKIVLCTVLCVFIVGGLANLYMYAYMSRIVLNKVEQIDAMQLRTVKALVDSAFDELLDLGVVCASNRSVQAAMKLSGLTTLAEKRIAIEAQNILNVSISAMSARGYVQKMIAFNTNGFMVQASNVQSGEIMDVNTIMGTPLFENRAQATQRPRFVLTESIISSYYFDLCFAALYKIQTVGGGADAYLYLELSPNIIKDALRPFADVNRTFFTGGDGSRFVVLNERDNLIAEQAATALSGNKHITAGGVPYELNWLDVEDSDALLWSYVDMSGLLPGERDMTYTLLIVVLTSLLIALLVAFLGSRYITKPVSRLIARLHKVSENDFSVDPSIERSQDEIGQIGRVVNEMVQSVSRLIDMNVQANNDIKNIEMSLLQAQVNPHFLYNTLDSIYWMAMVAKNPGICKLTRNLSSLLRNMSKGIGDRIPLREEIMLLDDYVAIQSVRFCGVFSFKNEVPGELLDYAIVKMTLQPIVENAIIHGIGSSDRLGVVTLSGWADEAFVYLVVEDDGAGMTPTQVESLLMEKQAANKNHLSGIGIENVHKRLKLVYGADCGLRIESEEGVYTRVTVTIRKELMSDV